MIKEWVWLWSDMIFWGLVISLIIAFLLPKQKHITQAWYFVGTSKMAVASGVLLFFFIGVTALDSLHFQNTKAEDKVESILDLALSPLNAQMETSYSTPFATHAYLASPIENKRGDLKMMKAKLVYLAPEIVTGKASMAWDIAKRVIVGAAVGGFIWLVLCGLLHFFIPFERMYQSVKYRFQWPTLIITLAAVCVSTGVILSLSKGYHILGTDKVGEDVFYQAVKGIRTGMLIGTLTTLILLPFSLLLGMVAGFFRGVADDMIQYLYTVLNSIPNVLLIAASVLMLEVVIENHGQYFSSIEMRADLRLLALCAILGVTSWTSLCRLIRAETLKLREQDYVKAAVALGTRPLNILHRHILPNLMHIVFITITLDFSGLVLAEAVLSYVGVGVDPSTYSWGNMINAARQELAREPIVWWSLFGAFIFMLSLVLPANLFADKVQQAFDPRARQVNDE
ncbi:MAG: ABC transporter permease [Gammaproteobacteria bacterium]